MSEALRELQAELCYLEGFSEAELKRMPRMNEFLTALRELRAAFDFLVGPEAEEAGPEEAWVNEPSAEFSEAELERVIALAEIVRLDFMYRAV